MRVALRPAFEHVVETCHGMWCRQGNTWHVGFVQVMLWWVCRFWWTRTMAAEHGCACQSRWAFLVCMYVLET